MFVAHITPGTFGIRLFQFVEIVHCRFVDKLNKLYEQFWT
jgi:hypothetical protein